MKLFNKRVTKSFNQICLMFAIRNIIIFFNFVFYRINFLWIYLMLTQHSLSTDSSIYTGKTDILRLMFRIVRGINSIPSAQVRTYGMRVQSRTAYTQGCSHARLQATTCACSCRKYGRACAHQPCESKRNCTLSEITAMVTSTCWPNRDSGLSGFDATGTLQWLA